jgi:hypothetical protein
MEMIRTITEDRELAAFARTLRAELLQVPTGGAALAMPVRLAEIARGSTDNGVTVRSSENGGRSHAVRPRLGTRLRRPLLRLAAAVVAIPLLFSGLAFAGVELPDPATDAFESVGIELPNQSADDDTAGTAHGDDSAGSESGQESSAGKLGGGQTESNPAGAGGRTEGNQAEAEKEGGAVGEPGLTPETPRTSGSQGDAVGKPVAPPAGAPESPGNSSESVPDSAGPGAAGVTVVGPLFSPDEDSSPETGRP